MYLYVCIYLFYFDEALGFYNNVVLIFLFCFYPETICAEEATAETNYFDRLISAAG